MCKTAVTQDLCQNGKGIAEGEKKPRGPGKVFIDLYNRFYGIV